MVRDLSAFVWANSEGFSEVLDVKCGDKTKQVKTKDDLCMVMLIEASKYQTGFRYFLHGHLRIGSKIASPLLHAETNLNN